MGTPVNFDNLRAITGGDPDLEKALFEAFVEGANESLRGLSKALHKGEDSIWRQQAHALKGVSLNLGALDLGHLCEIAQNDWRAADDEKRLMLNAIEDEYTRVRGAIGF